MTDQKTTYAVDIAKSPITGSFGSKYAPGLGLACVGPDKEAVLFLDLGGGPVIGPSLAENHSPVAIRFDQNKEFQWNVSAGANGGRYFFDDPVKLLAKADKAKRMLIGFAPVLSSQQVVVDFDISGTHDVLKKMQCHPTLAIAGTARAPTTITPNAPPTAAGTARAPTTITPNAPPTAAGTARAATTITPNAPPTAAETAAARRALSGDFTATERAEHHPLKLTVGHVDLNGDGRPDLIIHYVDPLWCNIGCRAYALLAGPGGYSTHAISLGQFDKTMTVLDTMHHGMHDLRLDTFTYVLHWTGTAYSGE